MRDVTELTEHEAELMNRAIETYPGALGYRPDRDPPVREVAAELIEEGRIERREIHDPEDGSLWISYRLRDEAAEEIRRTAAEKAKGAGLN
jgi:hypothetical protein